MRPALARSHPANPLFRRPRLGSHRAGCSPSSGGLLQGGAAAPSSGTLSRALGTKSLGSSRRPRTGGRWACAIGPSCVSVVAPGPHMTVGSLAGTNASFSSSEQALCLRPFRSAQCPCLFNLRLVDQRLSILTTHWPAPATMFVAGSQGHDDRRPQYRALGGAAQGGQAGRAFGGGVGEPHVQGEKLARAISPPIGGWARHPGPHIPPSCWGVRWDA